MNEKLLTYVRQMQEKGMSDSEIKENLKSVGWDEQTINQVFQADVPPNPQDYQMTNEEMRQLDPKAKILFFLSNSTSIASFILIVPVIFFALMAYDLQMDSFILILLIPFVLIVITYVIAQLEYNFYRYQLSTDGFYKERGIIAKKYVTIPYEKIQNIDIYQSIVARILGLYNLNIQTAGNSGVTNAEGILPGVSKDEAERLKNELLRRSRMFGQRNF